MQSFNPFKILLKIDRNKILQKQNDYPQNLIYRFFEFFLNKVKANKKRRLIYYSILTYFLYHAFLPWFRTKLQKSIKQVLRRSKLQLLFKIQIKILKILCLKYLFLNLYSFCKFKQGWYYGSCCNEYKPRKGVIYLYFPSKRRQPK